MAQAETYLAIVGSSTISIMDGAGGATNYRPATGSWSPRVARVRRDAMGGRGRFEDVEEEIRLHIYGTTPANCLTNLDTLTRVIEQANGNDNGDDFDPVYIKLALKGSDVATDSTPQKARVLRGSVSVSPAIEFIGSVPVIRDVVVRFTRQGQWLVNDQSATSSSTDNGTAATMGFSAATDILSPTDISLSHIVRQTQRAYLIVSDENKIDAMDAATMTATNYTAVDDSAQFAKSTNVLRYTPPDTAENASGNKTTTGSTGVQLTTGIFAVFINVRNNSSSTNFRVRLRLNGSGVPTYTPYLYIAPYSGSVYPEWKFVGLAYSSLLTTIALYITASEASGTLDIDTIVMVNVTNSRTNIVHTSLLEGGTAGYSGSSGALAVGHNLDAAQSFSYPAVTTISGAETVITHPADGDLIMYTSSASIFGMLMANGTSASTNTWRQADSGSLLANVWTATRAVGYLTPR